MGKIKDLTGQKFGHLTVLEITPERRNRQVVWKCQCDCGNITYVVGASLRNGHTQSCGCSWYNDKAEDLTGKQFGQLKVLKRNKEKNNKNRNAYWDCKCDCGNIRTVDASLLRTGKVTSCCNCNKKNKTVYYGGIGPIKNHTGDRFGLLTAIKAVPDKDKTGHAIWECLCDCGNICYVSSNSLITGNTQSCGCFKKSLGEEEIAKLLTNNNIHFIRQYTFEDCLSPKNSKLIFDFAVFDNTNNNLQYMIEYDGVQHFQPIEYFGGEENFLYQQQCDMIKNNYCQTHNIPLIRIPYTKQNKITIKDLLL